jgi:hypothetical protein
MARPLVISDCDEVLLHMMVPFRTWLDEAHDIHFTFGSPFEEAFRRKDSRDPVERAVIWSLLGGFFETEMHRQYPIKGALPGLARLSQVADIVVLTNLEDHRQAARSAQLAAYGLHVPVYCNRGGKGPAAARIIASYQPSVTVFIDDIESNHASLAEYVPQVWRLHMVGDAELSPHIATAPAAHMRIDQWGDAEAWIVARIADAR